MIDGVDACKYGIPAIRFGYRTGYSVFNFPCSVGDRFINLSGDLVTITKAGWWGAEAKTGQLEQRFTWDEIRGLIASAWKRVPADAKPKCIGCGWEEPVYQTTVFRCWRCRAGW